VCFGQRNEAVAREHWSSVLMASTEGASICIADGREFLNQHICTSTGIYILNARRQGILQQAE